MRTTYQHDDLAVGEVVAHAERRPEPRRDEYRLISREVVEDRDDVASAAHALPARVPTR